MTNYRKELHGRSPGNWSKKRFFLMMLVLVAMMTGCGSDSKKTRQADTPVRIAWAAEHQLLVSDYQSQSLQLRDGQTLVLQRKISIKGHPLAVGYSQGKVFVGNESTQCVEVYDSTSGIKLFTLGDGPGSIPLPNDLAIDEAAGRVLVTDSSGGRILAFSVDGPLLSTITDPLLIQPSAVAWDAAGKHLYVGDVGARSVLVFNGSGQFERRINGNFTHPKGLTLDDAGQLYLVDALLEQVLVFDLGSDLEIARFGVASPYAGPHKMPFDAVFDVGNQRLLVTDYLLGKIETFDATEINP